MSGPEIEIELRRDIQEKSGIDLNISGEDAFKLHDTYGIPLDLTKMWAEDLGLSVDVDRFNQLMEVQKTRSRHAPITGTLNVTLDDVTLSAQATVGRQVFRSKETAKGFGVLPSLSRFVGYDRLETETVIVATKDNLAVLAETPFYGESGGQVGDVGVLRIGDEEFSVTDTQKGPTSNILILDKQAEPYNGTRVHAKVRKPIRHNIERNHSATHIVHEALRRVLGTHVHQQGSLVAPDHLRFDFPHFGKITPEEIKAIEEIVNEKIADDISVFTEVDLPIEKARKIPSVKMFFGDKYGDIVRVVFIDENFSVEFCGGTHVKNTKDIGLFKIISESSIASGVRRIEAVTGEGVQAYINKQLEKVKHIDDQLAHLIDEKEMLERELNKYTAKSAVSSRPTLGAISLTSSQSESIKVLEKTLQEREQTIEHVSKQTQDLKKELSKYKVKEAASGIDSLIAQATALNGFKVVSSKVEASNMDELKSIGDTLRAKLGSGVGVLASVIDEKVSFVCVVTDDLIKSKNLQAGKIVGEMAKQVGGGGGGKAHLATAGGKDVSRLDDALRRTPDIVQAMIANK
jgi:alanyl-tRNA synthetase